MVSTRAIRLNSLQGFLSVLDTLVRLRRGVDRQPTHLVTGERGEQVAYFHLRKLGFIVVAQRWNDGPLPGDIDLIAWDGDVLCFIEVKTRTNKSIATASAAVDQHKRKTLRKLARQYIRQVPGGDQFESRPQTRFDIVTVYELPSQRQEVQLIPGAFGWSDLHRD